MTRRKTYNKPNVFINAHENIPTFITLLKNNYCIGLNKFTNFYDKVKKC